jgi:hypothetical protein
VGNFLTRMVESIGTTTMKAMLPDVYFMIEREEPVIGASEAVIEAENELGVE